MNMGVLFQQTFFIFTINSMSELNIQRGRIPCFLTWNFHLTDPELCKRFVSCLSCLSHAMETCHPLVNMVLRLNDKLKATCWLNPSTVNAVEIWIHFLTTGKSAWRLPCLFMWPIWHFLLTWLAFYYFFLNDQLFVESVPIKLS